MVFKPENSAPNKTRAWLNALIAILGILLPAAHALRGLQSFGQPKVKVPFCWKCNLVDLLPVIPFSVLAICVGFALYDLSSDNYWMLGLYIACILAIIGYLWYKYRSGQYFFNHPIDVSRYDNTYSYVIRRGPYYELAKRGHSFDFDSLQ